MGLINSFRAYQRRRVFGAKIANKSGVVPSPPDNRDYIYQPVSRILPSRVSLRQFGGDVKDQLSVGSCTTNDVANALELISTQASGADRLDLSRQYLYDRSAIIENSQGQSGRYLRDVLMVAKTFGVPLEQDCPYRNSEATETPTPEQDALAGQRKLIRFEKLWDHYSGLSLDWWAKYALIKSALSEGCPVPCAMYVNNKIFEITGPLAQQQYVGCSALYPAIGAHAVCIEEVDDALCAAVAENSWGTSFGDNGYFAIGLSILSDVFEAWAIRGFAGTYISPQFCTDEQIRVYCYNLLTAANYDIEVAGPQIWNACIQYGIETERLAFVMGWTDADVIAFAKSHNLPGV